MPVAEVAAVFGEARVVVAPYEVAYGSGVVALAMTMGRPVVATRVGDLPAAVADGTTGLLVEPGDPEALASALERIVGDPALAARMGAAGRERALAASSWEAAAAQASVALQAAVAGRGR